MCRFNEAGAFAPEILSVIVVVRRDPSGFNEAGAFAPEIFDIFACLRRGTLVLQ